MSLPAVSASVPTPTVSVIIPAYDAARWIDDALESCVAQSYPRLEVVVVDDGSRDETAARVEAYCARFPGIFRLVAAPHRGPSAARNVGVRASSGELLLFLDADDALEPGVLAAAASHMVEASCDVVLGDWCNVGEGSEPVRMSGAPAYPDDGLASYLLRPFVGSAALVKRTSVVWDEAIMRQEVFWYFFRVLKLSRRVGHLPIVFARIRQRTDPERLTIKTQHFEPTHMFETYLALKRELQDSGELTPRREEAIDHHLLAWAYRVRRAGHPVPREVVAVNRGRLSEYAWFKPRGLSGFARVLGTRNGIRVFYSINRALGRV